MSQSRLIALSVTACRFAGACGGDRSIGDRDPEKGEGLNALRNRKWDAVIDNSGYFPRQVTASARLLAPNVGQYIFISSISAYADNSIEGQAVDSDVNVQYTKDETWLSQNGINT